jgi:predicted AAA+ superfamily ATPase
MADFDQLIVKAETLLTRLEQTLPGTPSMPDWNASIAFRWRKRNGRGSLEPVMHPHQIQLGDLQDIDEQKRLIEQNTRQFVQGFPANNVLLTGARGTGKSSLVKAVLNRFSSKGLRLIEVEKHDLADLQDIVEWIYQRPERFILYCDDLSFESDDPGYKALKVALDGSVATASENIVIYATSNRRHLLPEYMEENLQTRHVGTEVHPGEAEEEKISLSERFGMWISFYPFSQDEYLHIVDHWVSHFDLPLSDPVAMHREALQWALGRGSRSGRVAWQFARDWAGRTAIRQANANKRAKR